MRATLAHATVIKICALAAGHLHLERLAHATVQRCRSSYALIGTKDGSAMSEAARRIPVQEGTCSWKKEIDVPPVTAWARAWAGT